MRAPVTRLLPVDASAHASESDGTGALPLWFRQQSVSGFGSRFGEFYLHFAEREFCVSPKSVVPPPTHRAADPRGAPSEDMFSDPSGLNAAPLVHAVHVQGRGDEERAKEANGTLRDPFDALEIFDLIREIKDPEHPHTLEELKVAQRDLIEVDDARGLIRVRFTPTIPHCSMATLIGLCIRVRLLRSLPRRLKLDIEITPGTHASEDSINKQLNDKERVAAALENHNLLKVVNECLSYREPGIADAR